MYSERAGASHDHRGCAHDHHGHGHDHGHEHEHEHDHHKNGDSHNIEMESDAPPPLAARDEAISFKMEDIIREVRDGAETAVQLDEYNMWNSSCLGDFFFLDAVLSKFPHVIHLYDNDGQSLLHWAALHNNLDAINALLRTGADADVLAKKTQQTPLLWACTRGHIDAIVALTSYGANIRHRDSVGANAMIIAVQYKEILTAHFLMSKGISPIDADINGCNSMHWAAYMDVVPLLRLFHTKCPEADQKDNEGYTVLHRAVYGVAEEAVQFLMEMKYDTNIKNKLGETPLDMAIAMNRPSKMIKLLSNNKKSGKGLRQITDNPAIALHAFPAAWVAIFILVIYVYYTQIILILAEPHPVMILILGIILLAHVSLYIYVKRSDPGYVGNEMIIDFENLVNETGLIKKVNPQQICYTCNIMKPLRSKHCRICDRCVYRFDHHCGWTGNCVGQKNHPYFVAFLVIQEIAHTLVVITSILALRMMWSENMSFFENILVYKSMTASIVINIFGIIMTGGLVKQHVEMVLHNETTNEVTNWARYPHFWKPVVNSQDGRRGLAYTNPFHQGYKNNCEQFCFGLPSEKEQSIFAKLDSVYVVHK